jgi:hypothetical protein
MEKIDVKSLKEINQNEINSWEVGNALAVIAGSILIGAGISLVKNLWNTNNGEIKAPGGWDFKWQNQNNNDSKNDVKILDKKIQSLEKQIQIFIPSFYEV